MNDDKVAKWTAKVRQRESEVAGAQANLEWFVESGESDKWSPEFLQGKKDNLDGMYRNLNYAVKMLDKAKKKRRLATYEGVRLLRQLVKEVVIAGEVDIADLYATYRPDDPKEYIGMVLAPPDEDGEGEDGDGEAGEDIAPGEADLAIDAEVETPEEDGEE
jgi:hypothetical protein